MENRRITIDKLQLAKSLCRATIHAIIHEDLKMKKVCAHWVPWDLMPEQREQNCQELLALHYKDTKGLSSRLVTGDESWFQYQTPKMKKQSMQWTHDDSLRPKKFRTTPSAGKQMASVFWYMEGILLIEWNSPRTNNQQSGVLQHPYVSLSQNPATAPWKIGTTRSVAP
jgi:histone-lysine N-methyltransferase SETMAR